MRRNIWELIDNTQAVLLGMAVCAWIVYTNLESFKVPLGDWYDFVSKSITLAMLVLFITSGWQAVTFISKNVTKLKKEDFKSQK